MKQSVTTFLKLIVSITGITYAFSKISLSEVGAAVTGATWQWLLFALILMTISLIVRAYRWLLLLRGLGNDVQFGRLIALYFIGNFFNAITPGGVGGDVVRAVAATRDVPPDVAAGTVILDRMCGLLMLFGMALAALPFGYQHLPTPVFWLILTISLTGIIGGVILLEGSVVRLVHRWLMRYGEQFIVTRLIQKKLMPILWAVQGCGWIAVSRALAVSLLFNLMMVTWWYAVGRALHLDVAWGYYLLVAPIMSIAQLVSMGGLGGRELLAPALFAGANVPDELAVALTLVIFILLRVTSLFGMPFYLFSSLKRETEHS